jgi:uncharacterized protein
MDEIYIPQLKKAPNRTEVIQFKEFLTGPETLTPVQGQLAVTHQSNYLEVSVQAETIITLTCHRCLQQYNHRLEIEASELIWLDEAADEPDTGPLEREVAVEDLVETLPPQGYFDPGCWLYEQLCLAIPQRQLCDQQCLGIVPQGEELAPAATVDRRWAALEALKKNFSC